MYSINKLHALVLTGALLGLSGCDASYDPPSAQRAPLVVEGWIESDGHPTVLVSRAVPILPGAEIQDALVTWCKVTVDDGERSVVLTGRHDADYFPPTVYSSSRITGVPGRTYRLTVVTETDTLEAVTTIPEPLRLDSLTVSPSTQADMLFAVHAFAAIDPAGQGSYKIFTRVLGSDTRYYASFLGTVAAARYDAATGINVTRGIHLSLDGHILFMPLFRPGERIDVKLCTLTPEAFAFWEAYEEAVSLGSVMFFGNAAACPGNVAGGRGLWAGYGVSRRQAVIPDR